MALRLVYDDEFLRQLFRRERVFRDQTYLLDSYNDDQLLERYRNKTDIQYFHKHDHLHEPEKYSLMASNKTDIQYFHKHDHLHEPVKYSLMASNKTAIQYCTFTSMTTSMNL